MSSLNLAIPPEPVEDKKRYKRELESGERYTKIEQGTWITTPLWKEYGWKEVLKSKGISWQKFMKLYGNVSIYFVDWVKDRVSWEAAVNRLIEEVEDYLRGEI